MDRQENAAGGRAGEPWMRGTKLELDALRRGVVHALEQAEEDEERWCAPLLTGLIHERPLGLSSVAFHLRHAVRSLDRLLTYAEDAAQTGGLDETQRAALETEMEAEQPAEAVRAEFREGIAAARRRVLRFDPAQYEEPRGIGRRRLPTTLGGLLLHCAEHTQRHIGQAITTAQVVHRLAERTGRAEGGTVEGMNKAQLPPSS